MTKRLHALLCLLTLCVFLPAASSAQQTANLRNTAAQQGVFIVFPFVNDGASARLDWLSEGLEELTIQRLAAAGQPVYSHSGRVGELDRYGLPSGARLSHATMLRIGADLDADFVVFGKFSSDGDSLTIETQVMRVDPPKLLPAVRETGKLDALMELHTKVMWRLLAANDKAYPLNLAEFSKTQRRLRLDAFEHYIRGLNANDDDTKLKELREAARLEPEWADPPFALGEAYFARRDCNMATPQFVRIPANSAQYAEAQFSIGVCRLLLSQPDKAEETFTALQATLKDSLVSGADLPEVLNNLALSRSRQGNAANAVTPLQRAVDLDPNEDDFPFNLGLLYLKQNEASKAADQFREATEREPDNPEDRALLIYALEKAGKKDEAEEERNAALEALGPNALPTVKADGLAKLERVTTELDTVALRLETGGQQAAAATGAASANSSAALVRKGRQELSAGRLETAETAFQSASAADPQNGAAHRGLADIARRRNKLDEAAKELLLALARRDSAADRTVLARIYIEQKKTDLARTELEHALKLAPNYAEAKQLLEHLQSGKPGGRGK